MADTVPRTEYIKANKKDFKNFTCNSENIDSKHGNKSCQQDWEVGKTPILQMKKTEA